VTLVLFGSTVDDCGSGIEILLLRMRVSLRLSGENERISGNLELLFRTSILVDKLGHRSKWFPARCRWIQRRKGLYFAKPRL